MQKFQNAKYILVIGIGGSDLASKAVWNAMSLHKKTGKKIYFLESPDEREYEEIKNIVENEIKELEEICLIVVSKSGQTAETLETFDKIYKILSKTPFEMPQSQKGVFDKINERILIISTKDSSLWKIAEEKNIEKIEWEGDVGGRFSAFTIAHTSILSIAGLDVENFIIGSKEKKEEETKHLAQNIYENYKNGADILDFFIFNSELEDLGKWCRQLIAESLSLITPTVSIGPTDLHSMLELYLGGPKNRFTIFIKSKKEIDETINESAYENVTSAYQKAGLPFIKYEMTEINEKELGTFMAFMIETTLELAKLLEVNPYDQPAIEKYKKEITPPNPLLQQEGEPNPKNGAIIFDIGATKTRMAFAENEEKFEEPVIFETNQNYEDGLKLFVETAKKMAGEREIKKIIGGMSRSVWEGNYEKLKKDLQKEFNCEILIENDASMAGVGEAQFGAGREFEIVAYMTVSTGVGGAKIVNGKIDEHAVGFEPGKQIINIETGKTLEDMISGKALEQKTGKHPKEIKNQGVWDNHAWLLAIGLNNIIIEWSPNVVVLGGSMITGDPAIPLDKTENYLKDILKVFPTLPVIKKAELGDFGGLWGALTYLK